MKMVRRGLVLGIVLALGLVPAACDSDDSGSGDALPRSIQSIMDESRYSQGEWGLLVTDVESGEVVYALNEDQFFIPGSNVKLYSLSAELDLLGPDHTFVTPVYANGTVDGPVLTGDLVLVASGDLVFGGRGATEGEIAFEDSDHNDANALPGATLTPQDPLAGLDALATQVAAAGITSVAGDVVIDDRLFETDTEMNPEVPTTPIMVNENLIDLLVTPTSAGQPADLTWRPQTAAYTVSSTVTTVEEGGTADVEITSPAPGQIAITGTIAAGEAPLLRTYQVDDPPAFARTAFIEALGRAGVTVAAPATGPNPADRLPAAGSYAPDSEVASFVSPPFREYLDLVMKVSLNLGANLAVCLMAVEAGSTDCADGFAQIGTFLEKAGVDPTDVALTTGQGGMRSDLVTPEATVGLVSYWHGTDEFEVFKESLPILGVDGSLATVQTDSPAAGEVFAKTGTHIDTDDVNLRAMLGAKALGGYIESADGRLLAFGLYVNNATLETLPDDFFAVSDDLGAIAAAIQQEQ